MNTLRRRTSVFGGAAIGVIAGVAVYGAVTSGLVAASLSTTAIAKPAQVLAAKAPAVAPVRATSCASGAKLEHGVCIIHVERVVVRAAPPAARAQSQVVALALAPLRSQSQSQSQARVRTRAAAAARARTTSPAPPRRSVPTPPRNPEPENPAPENPAPETPAPETPNPPSSSDENNHPDSKDAGEQAKDAAEHATVARG